VAVSKKGVSSFEFQVSAKAVGHRYAWLSAIGFADTQNLKLETLFQE
jgi:hypothetical protein